MIYTTAILVLFYIFPETQWCCFYVVSYAPFSEDDVNEEVLEEFTEVNNKRS